MRRNASAECAAHYGRRQRVKSRTGSPPRRIVDVARERDIDLIVMGTRGRTGLAHIVMGSVAERVVRLAPCPVLTLRQEVTKAYSRKAVGIEEEEVV